MVLQVVCIPLLQVLDEGFKIVVLRDEGVLVALVVLSLSTSVMSVFVNMVL